MKLCKCGCGREVKKENRYINGHNIKGKPSVLKNRTWEEISGKEQSQERKKNLSWKFSGKLNPSFGKHWKIKDTSKMGHLAWNKGLTKEMDNRIKKYGDKIKGKKSWNIGLTKETDERLKRVSNKRKGIPKSEEHKRKIGEGNKGKILSEETKQKIKQARRNQIFPIKDTSIEIKIQNFLKQLQIEFFTHQYIKDIEHGYQCDILIPSKNLVIECDGNYWHKYPIGKDIDHIRTSELIEKGFKVLRLWESEIRVMELNDLRNMI